MTILFATADDSPALVLLLLLIGLGKIAPLLIRLAARYEAQRRRQSYPRATDVYAARRRALQPSRKPDALANQRTAAPAAAASAARKAEREKALIARRVHRDATKKVRSKPNVMPSTGQEESSPAPGRGSESCLTSPRRSSWEFRSRFLPSPSRAASSKSCYVSAGADRVPDRQPPQCPQAETRNPGDPGLPYVRRQASPDAQGNQAQASGRIGGNKGRYLSLSGDPTPGDCVQPLSGQLSRRDRRTPTPVSQMLPPVERIRIWQHTTHQLPAYLELAARRGVPLVRNDGKLNTAALAADVEVFARPWGPGAGLAQYATTLCDPKSL